MIVVAVLGILAAIVVPQFQNYAVEANESVAKEGLRILRSAIEVYAAQNDSIPPGYEDNDPDGSITASCFVAQLTTGTLTSGKRYMNEMPKNPFNGLKTMKMVGNLESFPSAPTGEFGWVYQPATRTIRLDWPGTDKDSQAYFAY